MNLTAFIALTYITLWSAVTPLEARAMTPYIATTTEQAQLSTSTITFATSTLITEPSKPEIPAVMVRVAECESGNRQFYDNGKLIRDHVYGTHLGVYQISQSYAKDAARMGMDIYTREGNIGYALYMYHRDGLSPWDASRYCWGK